MLTSRYFGDFLALFAGALLPLAFAPFSWYPLAILSPFILLCVWQAVSPKRAGWRGFLYGIGLFGVGVSWVNVSFYSFGGMPLFAALLLTGGFVVVLSLFPAGLGLFITRFFPQDSYFKWVFILPASWVFLEWVRSWFLSGFPWLSIGYSQIDSPLSGFAPLLGVYGVSFVVMLSASLLLATGLFQRWRLVTVTVLVVMWVGAWFLTQQTWTHAIDNPIKVALIQGNIPQEFKWLEGKREESVRRYAELSQQNLDANLIIWPETAIPWFYEHMQPLFDWMKTQHNAHQVDFIVGVPYSTADGRYFNSVTNVSAATVQFYHKHHLVPFGEYIPLSRFIGVILDFLNAPLSEFSAGEAYQKNLSAVQQSIGISICYEDVFGERVRTGLPEATLLVNVSNDAWFGDSIAPHQHLEIARMRALEAGRYLLRATNTGMTAVIDPQGKVTAIAPQFKIYVLRAEVRAYQGITPYVRWGDSLIVIFVSCCLLLGLGLQWRNKRLSV
ncbi:apolipoprotein N-acyltransferase [Beggiatoa leptomitoformis]|uniref:Apolipoprotein N-acyltransferase n=1 Tax=Beggiatoa leptomitoformis TaxID=288004 RepID=A0A2N9YBF5_9GAMM|nr:apolipoprotein N-acyltransferase [Beggiatoa leptomitoformis]ALG66839.2 apolipoprotein N-acyltransferase [Beggiatoa leptomitoformis]AUI67810.1 apolipoprotein N-acyltransferase [Beggiatoa leptomitoformis]